MYVRMYVLKILLHTYVRIFTIYYVRIYSMYVIYTLYSTYTYVDERVSTVRI